MMRGIRWFEGPLSLLKYVLRQLGHGLGSVFFIPNPWIGLLLWLALFSNPRFGAFALGGLMVGVCVKRLLRGGEQPSVGGGIKANAMLTSLVVAWLTSAIGIGVWVQIFIAVAASAVASIVTAGMMSVFGQGRFPVLISGYCLVASSLFVICPNCTVLSANAMAPWVQINDALGWGESFLRSMGGLVYSPSLEFGVLVCLAVGIWSPATLFTGCVAWLAGSVVSLAFQTMGFVFYFFPLSYNYFIAGLALGAVIFLPGRRSLVVAAIAGAMTAFWAFALQVWLMGGASSYLPISSILTIWLGIGALTLAGGQSPLARYVSSRFPPELAWCRKAYLEQRFGDDEPLLAIPVVGALKVSQGFDGGVTHVSAWAHALDFQSAFEPVKGSSLFGNPIWGASVISPASGTVERVRNDVPDNALGGSNFADNWGNHVVIRMDRGEWVVLAHLLQWSICVQAGSRVEAGAYLGRVGNSGRSPTPHLHMQLQGSAVLGAPTRPFRLANFCSAETPDGPWLYWNSSAVPKQGDCVCVAQPSRLGHELLSSMMPGVTIWYLEVKGRLPREVFRPNAPKTIKIVTTVDETGRYRLDSGRGGRLMASLDPDAWRIAELERVSCGFLKLLAIGIPCIPYALVDGMVWHDVPPLLPSAMSPAVSIAPFVGRRFPQARYEGVAVPGSDKAIEIRATLEADDPRLPKVVVCRLEGLKGVVNLLAEFESGTVEYKQLSFAPGLPPMAPV